MLGFIVGILIVAVCYAISWAITCGVIYLITVCFGLEFSWLIATGIWLILCLLGVGKPNIKIDM